VDKRKQELQTQIIAKKAEIAAAEQQAANTRCP
jgi:hypothetical protein